MTHLKRAIEVACQELRSAAEIGRREGILDDEEAEESLGVASELLLAFAREEQARAAAQTITSAQWDALHTALASFSGTVGNGNWRFVRVHIEAAVTVHEGIAWGVSANFRCGSGRFSTSRYCNVGGKTLQEAYEKALAHFQGRWTGWN